jgi:hypothetical protein
MLIHLSTTGTIKDGAKTRPLASNKVHRQGAAFEING